MHASTVLEGGLATGRAGGCRHQLGSGQRCAGLGWFTLVWCQGSCMVPPCTPSPLLRGDRHKTFCAGGTLGRRPGVKFNFLGFACATLRRRWGFADPCSGLVAQNLVGGHGRRNYKQVCCPFCSAFVAVHARWGARAACTAHLPAAPLQMYSFTSAGGGLQRCALILAILAGVFSRLA